jgi:hypothetical protein
MPEIMYLPNRFRPGVGKTPQRETRRPILPQAAVHCPVLGAASALGFWVYPALAEGEAFQIRYLPDERYLFSFFVRINTLEPIRAFSLSYTLSGIRAGQWTEELVYLHPEYKGDDASIRGLRDALFTAQNVGSTMPGAIGLLGATNFVTPEGWDTVYTGVLNNPSSPSLNALTVRVETDWFAFDSEFRYVLQAGDSVGAGPGDPIGQVFFVPREPFTLHAGTDQNLADFSASVEKFLAEKLSDRVESPSGIVYSPAYAKRMKATW